jgi:nucleoside transporter
MANAPASISSSTAAPPLPLGLNTRLSVMMFLQYAIWGAWLPVLLPFLLYRKFSGDEIGTIFAVGAAGAIFAPFIAGQIADRYFPTQFFLGLSHIAGGILVWQLASLETFSAFVWFSLIYSIIYTPTLSLTNSLSFHHLPDRDRDFGRIRIWGTVGWIAAGIAVGQWLLYRHTPADASADIIKEAWAAGRADAFKLSAVLGIMLGVYCFFLPSTPPQKGKQPFAAWEARNEVQRNPRLIALFMFSLIISCIHQFYFIHTSDFISTYQARAEKLVGFINKIFGVGGGGLMTIGQVSEFAVLALMPILAKRFSRKTLLTVGVIAYGLRMALFAYVDSIAAHTGISEILILILGVSMHGLCFGCFIFVAFLIVDEETSPDVRASAQSLYNVVIIGFGIIVGSKIALAVLDWAKQHTTATGGSNFYVDLFAAPMWAAALTLVAFLFLYPGKKIGGNGEVSA